MKLSFSNDDFLVLGMKHCGFSKKTISKCKATTGIVRFCDKFYVGPKTCSEIFLMIQEEALGQHTIEKPNPSHLLLALYYLKKYPTKHELAGFLDSCEETALKHAKRYTSAIAALRLYKIKWIFDENTDEDFILSVDGVHCRVFEPRIDPSTKWFSSKFNKAALSYELGIAIFHDQLVWVSGPHPAATNDITIFKMTDGLMEKIPDGKIAIGDEGYRGVPDKCATRNSFDTDAVKLFKKRVKARHESFNCRIKAFNVIDQPFRSTGESRMEKHEMVFIACCVLVQFEMDGGRPLFKV